MFDALAGKLAKAGDNTTGLLGVRASWYSQWLSLDAISVGQSAALYSATDTDGVTSNAVATTGGWKYIKNGTARLVQMNLNGTLTFFYGASGVAGNNISWVTEATLAGPNTKTDTTLATRGEAIPNSRSVGADTTLLSTDGVVKITGGSTYTLPFANALGSGKSQTLTIKNLSGASVTVQRQGTTDVIYLFGGTTGQTNSAVTNGTTFCVRSNGTNDWYVVA